MYTEFTIGRHGLFDALEARLSLSSMSLDVGTIDPTIDDDDLPPPNPEEDPGELPTDDPPIIYPPLPPTGPVGPG